MQNSDRREIQLTSNDLYDLIFYYDRKDDTKPAFRNNEFYFEGSPMRRAGKQYKASLNNPNERPIPFIIPSLQYTDLHWGRLALDVSLRPDMTDEERKLHYNPPTYSVSGMFQIGGSMDYDASKIEWKSARSDIYLNDITFEEHVRITNFKSEFKLCFANCSFNGGLQIHYNDISELSFHNCNLGGCTAFNSKYNLLTFTNCSFNLLNITNDYEGSPEQGIIIDDIEHTVKTLTLGGNKGKELSILGKNTEMIYFDEDEIDFIKIDQVFNILSIINKSDKYVFVNELLLKATPQENQVSAIFDNLSVEVLSIKGEIFKTTLSFYNILCRVLSIKDFINNGKFLFDNFIINKGGRVEFIRADLSSFQLMSTNFSEAESFVIRSSNITNIATYDTVFPELISSNSNSKENLNTKRDIYRHLKNAASKQSDRLNELRYEAIEMKILGQILEETSNQDRWIFRINNWSSKHGQDWRLVIKKFLFVSIPAFCVIQLLMGYTSFNPQAVFANLASFTQFANPIHRFGETFGYQQALWADGLAQLVDALYRLFASYMVFQFLRAFRKYFR